MSAEPLRTGLEASADANARVLILGSMPSALSLQHSQYYGNPQNAFWWIMGELFDASPEHDYQDRLDRLKDQGVALWDVTRQCRRQGSLDSAIEREGFEANDFIAFFTAHPLVHTVFFNGQASANLFRRHVLKVHGGAMPDLEQHTLPSTSPANAAIRREEKLVAWQHVTRALAND